jgi:hypothetical protein
VAQLAAAPGHPAALPVSQLHLQVHTCPTLTQQSTGKHLQVHMRPTQDLLPCSAAQQITMVLPGLNFSPPEEK